MLSGPLSGKFCELIFVILFRIKYLPSKQLLPLEFEYFPSKLSLATVTLLRIYCIPRIFVHLSNTKLYLIIAFEVNNLEATVIGMFLSVSFSLTSRLYSGMIYLSNIDQNLNTTCLLF